MNSILTVCVGNICRSPLAEGFLKTHLPGKKIFSAGIGALVGKEAHTITKELAQKENIDLSNHRAQQLTSYLCAQADLILVMEKKHKTEIEKLYPQTKGKVHQLGQIDGKIFDIDDPYKKTEIDFKKAHNEIKKSAYAWSKLINSI